MHAANIRRHDMGVKTEHADGYIYLIISRDFVILFDRIIWRVN